MKHDIMKSAKLRVCSARAHAQFDFPRLIRSISHRILTRTFQLTFLVWMLHFTGVAAQDADCQDSEGSARDSLN